MTVLDLMGFFLSNSVIAIFLNNSLVSALLCWSDSAMPVPRREVHLSQSGHVRCRNNTVDHIFSSCPGQPGRRVISSFL